MPYKNTEKIALGGDMKNLIKLLVVMLTMISAAASVNTYHAMNVFKGEYQFNDPMTGEKVEFTITKKMKLVIKENDTYYEGRVHLMSHGLGIGPGDLPILTILLTGGSDEQTQSMVLRLYPEQDSSTVAKLLDAVFTENDGPNEITYIERYSKIGFRKN